jgi:hypothetical protein
MVLFIHATREAHRGLFPQESRAFQLSDERQIYLRQLFK